MSSEMTL